jgi:hypothetical protein
MAILLVALPLAQSAYHPFRRLRKRRSNSKAGPESHSTTPRRVRCGLGPTAHWHASLSSGWPGVAGVCVVLAAGVCVRVGDADDVAVGVGPTGVNVAHTPLLRQAAWRTGSQPVGHAPSLGTAQVFPSHWQQSFAPRVAVGVAVGPVGVAVGVGVPVTGVNVAQFPVLKHAAWRTGLQPVGQVPSLGTAHVLPSHWQQSFAPSVAVAVAVGVGVNVAQAPLCRHAAWRTRSQSAGHIPSLGSAQVLPVHWQQSCGPGVADVVAVGVGVKVAHVPLCRHAAWRTRSQSAGHIPSLGTAHVLPAH